MQGRSKRVPILLASLFLLAGCMSVRVETDYDPATDFSQLRTYAWMAVRPTGDPRIDSDLLHQRVRRAVDDQLAAKGFARREADPDFLVIEHFVVEKRIDVDTYASSYGYRMGPVYTQTYVREYELGTMILDVVDAGTRRLLWRGSGQARVNENATPEQRAERVRAVVEKVLASFPPGGSA